MISLKKYFDSNSSKDIPQEKNGPIELTGVLVAAYLAALAEMGAGSEAVCPAAGDALRVELARLGETISTVTVAASAGMGAAGRARKTVTATGDEVVEHLKVWSGKTVQYYRENVLEVKEMIMLMARTAECVGAKDTRCAEQMMMVTSRLEEIATLDDMAKMRASIVRSAAELKQTIEDLTKESEQTITHLRKEVSRHQAKVEEAEYKASMDLLTGLRSRGHVENQIKLRIELGGPMCVAIMDINQFKMVNDTYGHRVGDELLRQFAINLQSVCRSTDTIGRWGGDEFIILLDCDFVQARVKVDHLLWSISREYAVKYKNGPLMLRVTASIGLAEHRPGETMAEVIERADGNMYELKGEQYRSGVVGRAS